MKWVIATFNPDKLRELEQVLRRPGDQFVGLGEIPGAEPPPEVGETLEANALLKAMAGMERSGLPTIADDTGLEVDALGGLPGVRSARFAGPRATYADNLRRLLAAMRGIEPARRSARFRTVCVACLDSRPPLIGVGVLEGRITDAPRGSGGFGYDPVFEVEGLGRTLAELSAAEKNRLSHRALAARDLSRKIERLRTEGLRA
jgi:XTP/dITP diphosphohydrolase